MNTKVEQLPAILDLRAAVPLQRMLLAERGTNLRLSGARVQRLGAQCLQVLLSAQATWAADGKTLTIIEPSTEFTSSVEQFGLHDPMAVFGQEQRP